LEDPEHYPELVAIEKANGEKHHGGFWSIIEGRNLDNYATSEPVLRPAKRSKKQE
jgi:hypothetical protein